MKIEISKNDLHTLRELLWEGRAFYARNLGITVTPSTRECYDTGTKMIKKVNAALKKVHGHDCNGDDFA